MIELVTSEEKTEIYNQTVEQIFKKVHSKYHNCIRNFLSREQFREIITAWPIGLDILENNVIGFSELDMNSLDYEDSDKVSASWVVKILFDRAYDSDSDIAPSIQVRIWDRDNECPVYDSLEIEISQFTDYELVISKMKEVIK